MTDISTWLEARGLERYTALFKKNDIDLDVLPELTEAHLESLGVSLGHRLKMLREIKKFSSAQTASSSTGADSTADLPVSPSKPGNNHGLSPANGPVPAAGFGLEHNLPTPSDTAERRHLTVMFVDLVGSTRLSQQFDPEDLREIIRAYQKAVTRELKRYDGFISRYMGDGIIAYFGWPRAYEDSAERAIWAGLAANAVVAKLHTPDGTPLAARTGIASGLVVVGDLIGEGASEEEAVVGETPNLAARIQGVAAPGEVAVSDSSRQLVGELFSFDLLGAKSLKGIDRKVNVYRAQVAQTSLSRFHARQSNVEQMPLVGRESEMTQMRDRWNLALDGDGQVVVLSGEAGIGKSRILDGFETGTVGEGARRVLLQCSPYHTDTAFYPVWQWIQLSASVSSTDSDDDKIDKLVSYFEQKAGDKELAFLVAANLGFESTRVAPYLATGPDQLRRRTLNGLVAHFVALAADKPTLVIIEDTHWIDPTSMSMLENLAEALGEKRAMLLFTSRPTSARAFDNYPEVNLITLSRLARTACVEIISRLTGGRELPQEILHRLLKKTDGIPLFVEELTKTVLESGQLSEVGNSYESAYGGIEELDIPSSLQDSLMSRLDRLQPVREIAQTASCIGREFNQDLLVAVIKSAGDNIKKSLDSLVEAELIYQRGIQPNVDYVFKHALVRDAAYKSLLRSRRRVIHARIAEVLHTDPVFKYSVGPELLAHHYGAAEDYEHAVECYIAAARNALARSANQEALVHAENGLKLSTLIDLPLRLQYEKELHFCTAMAQRILRGFHSAHYYDAVTKAGELAELTNDIDAQINCVRGQFNHFFNRGQHNNGDRIIREQLDVLLTRIDFVSPGSTRGANSLYRGELQEASDELEKMLAVLEPAEDYPERAYVLNPVTSTLANLGWAKWLLGYPDQALKHSMDAVDIARRIEQPLSFAMAVVWAGQTQHAIGCASTWGQVLEEAGSLIEEYDIQAWAPRVLYLRGKYQMQCGNAESGEFQMREALGIVEQRDSKLSWTWMCAEMAAEQMRLQELTKSKELLASGIEHAHTYGERFWLPELYRLTGLLQQQSKNSDAKVAREWINKAYAAARENGDRSCALRALTSLNELPDASADDRLNLEKLTGEFEEGLETVDLRLARSLVQS